MNKPIEIRSIISVGVGDGKLLLEVETAPDVFQCINFNWRDFANIYEYITLEEDKRSEYSEEILNRMICKCGHTRSNHGCVRDDGCDNFEPKDGQDG